MQPGAAPRPPELLVGRAIAGDVGDIANSILWTATLPPSPLSKTACRPFDSTPVTVEAVRCREQLVRTLQIVAALSPGPKRSRLSLIAAFDVDRWWTRDGQQPQLLHILAKEAVERLLSIDCNPVLLA